MRETEAVKYGAFMPRASRRKARFKIEILNTRNERDWARGRIAHLV